MIIFICILYGFLSMVISKETYYCTEKQDDLHYCSYTVGDPRSNIIINAPHGGELLPKNIKKREAGCLVGNKCRWEHECGKKDFDNCQARCVTDHFTGEISKQLAKDITKITGIRPHLLVNEVQRAYFDGNREIREATFGDPVAIKTFHEYQNFIRKATENVKKPALFIEMHGQRHPAEWFEIGYLIKAKSLDEGAIDPDYSSIRGLFLRKQNKYSFKEMIQGNKSMGYLFQQKGYKTVPSPAYPGPSNLGYYKGGFNMQVHAALWDTQIDAVQIEFPDYIRNKKSVSTVAKDTAKIILQWKKMYYEDEDDEE